MEGEALANAFGVIYSIFKLMHYLVFKIIRSLFLLIIPVAVESSDSTNAGQRVRVLRGSGRMELLGQIGQ